MELSSLLLSRLQFAFIISFHIILGLSEADEAPTRLARGLPSLPNQWRL